MLRLRLYDSVTVKAAAADFLKLNFPAAFSATLLAWGLIEFQDVSAICPLPSSVPRCLVMTSDIRLFSVVHNEPMNHSLTKHAVCISNPRVKQTLAIASYVMQ